MNILMKLARHSFWLVLSRVVALGLTVLVTYLLARRLGTAGFGQYAFIATVLMIGNTLTTFGSDMVLIREIAAKADFAELPSVVALQLMLSGLFIGIVYWLAPRFPNQTPESVLALKVYSLALIPLAFFTVFTSVLRGVQKMIEFAWLNFFLSAVQAVAIFIFTRQTSNIVMLAYLLLAVQILGALFAGALCLDLLPAFRNGLYFSWAKLYSLFVVCLPVALIAIVGILYQKISLTMLSVLGTASMTGLFSAGSRIIEAARLGHVAVLTALYPTMADTNDEAHSREALNLSWCFLLAVSTVGATLLFLLAKPVVNMLFGTEYQSSIMVLKILAFTLIPYTVNSFLSLMFLARHEDKLVLWIFVVSLGILFLLNLRLIPAVGQVGASWATLSAEGLQAVLFLLAWLKSPFRKKEAVHANGVSYELSDLS